MPEQIVVQDREELIYLLCEAAEFEHTVMCSYLYAQWSLKRDASEGVTPTELAAIERWRRSLGRVALEEMLHLSLVNNLLAAIGAAPHLWRPAFPVRPGHFPADVVMTLMPFGDAALDHFMFIERPEGIDIADGAGFSHANHYRRIARPDLLAPAPQDYASQGHLYHGAAARARAAGGTARRRPRVRRPRPGAGRPRGVRPARPVPDRRPRVGAARDRGDRHAGRRRAGAQRRLALRPLQRDQEGTRRLARGATRLRARAPGRPQPDARRPRHHARPHAHRRSGRRPGGRSRQLDLRADGARAVAGLRARPVAAASCAARWRRRPPR